MADEADIANDAIQADLDRRLAEHRARQQSIGPENCDDCDEPIPSARRNLGLRLCIDCARQRESRGRLFYRD